MKGAIYCRVSTEGQEREGTSLQSQQEACMKAAQEQGYEVPERFIALETYSGLSLDRPKLNEVRQWVRDQEVSVVIAYTLDRLSRDPVHFIILQEELKRAGVEIIFVTETNDSSDLGMLITHIKGYAAKLEAEKIKERTVRGIKERVKAGKFPSGRRARLYGYTYVPGKGDGEGIRYINEEEAERVREMFKWLVDESMTLNGITYRLRESGVPTPTGKGYWIRSTVYKTLTNPAYTGKTYCFTQVHQETNKHYKEKRKSRKTSIITKPYEEGMEIKGATPPIIDQALFDEAQYRLKRNKGQPNREGKVKYLLRGHIICSRCGRKYWGYARWNNGEPTSDRRYYCMGRRSIITPDKCTGRGYKADEIEALVWQQIEELLARPDMILADLQRRKEDAQGQSHWERRLKAIETSLAGWEKRMDNLARAATLGLPEDSFKRELGGLNREKAELEQEKAELGQKVTQAVQVDVEKDGIVRFCELARQNLKALSFEEKRSTLDALRVQVLVDGDDLAIAGAIPVLESAAPSTRLACNHPRWCRSGPW